MDAFDPQNDLIDSYLKGELSGKALDDFHQQLNTDSALREDVQFRALLVNGIKNRGAMELKNFIRQRTTQKRVIKISFQTWYYAAAALAILLLGASAVLYFSSGGMNENLDTAVATESTAPNGAIDNAADMNKNNTEEPGSKKSSADSSVANNIYPGTVEAPPDDYLTDKDGADIDYPDAVIIASNIPVQSIRIESELDDAVMMESTAAPVTVKATKNPVAKTSGTVGQSEMAPTQKSNLDSAIKKNRDAIAKNSEVKTTAEKFRLSFVNTQDAKPFVSLDTKDDKTAGSTEVVVYNLPYDNPLIFNLNERYFLKTGEKYYEINIHKAGKQTVTPVTDKEILAALEN